MSFSSKNITQTTKRGISFLKGATFFFLGMSLVLFVTKAFEVVPTTQNFVSYFQKMFLTPDGFNLLPETISLDGVAGDASFAGTVTGTTVNATTVNATTVCLSTDPGTPCRTTWPTGGVSSANAAGNTTNIQFNGDGTNFSGSDYLTWNVTANLFNVIGVVTFGNMHTLTNSTGSSILGGYENTIMGGEYSAIVGGVYNKIYGHKRAVILGGSGNVIDAGVYPPPPPPSSPTTNNMFETILNGSDNRIDNSSYSLIAGGKKALISGHKGVFLWSDSSNTGFTSQKDDTFIIKASGGVGIGTANPTAQLQIDANSGSIKITNGMSGGIGSSTLSFRGDINSTTTGIIVGQYNNSGPFPLWGGMVNFDGPLYFGSTIAHPLSIFISTGGKVGIATTNPTEALEVNGNIKLSGTGVISAAASTSNQLYLGANGYVGIGKSNPSERLDVNGEVIADAYYYSSDERLKTDIVAITNPLEKILALNGYLFTWKETGRRDMGVIAQEVEQIFPEIIHTNNEGYKSVEYGNLVAPLIEAIKELNIKINTQAEEIKYLQQQINK